jgi:hypothetical protein
LTVLTMAYAVGHISGGGPVADFQLPTSFLIGSPRWSARSLPPPSFI